MTFHQHIEITSLEEEMFDQIYPRSKGLYTKLFKRAMKDWKRNGSGAMPVHIMGHSLYSRYLDNSEKIDRDIVSRLSGIGNPIDMKSLLIDPAVEKQVVSEFYDAQREYEDPSEKDKSNYTSYSGDWESGPSFNIDDKETDNHFGDIDRSLEILREWAKEVRGGSSLEVRLTKRLMYCDLIRLGNYIVVTPYHNGGLFEASLVLVLTNRSPLFDSYGEVFDNIWKSSMETRIAVHKYDDPSLASE